MTAHTADEIIEAMARAAFKTDWPKDNWDRLGPGYHQGRYCEMARAAYAECLRMMREPTSEQEDAGFLKDGDEHRALPDDHWRAMIDARLKELG